MLCVKRALAVFLLAVVTAPAYAFTFSYGNLFEVKEVKNAGGVLQLPLTRKKYKNVKILSKELYGFLRACPSDCTYVQSEIKLETAEYRAAASRQDMWIADVSVNGDILLTCLVFKSKKGFDIKLPEKVHFTDAAFQTRIRKFVEQTAMDNL